MSQILKQLSETDEEETKKPSHLKLLPENIFENPPLPSDAEKSERSKLFLKRIGASLLAIALLGFCLHAFRKKPVVAPLLDLGKLTQEQISKLNREAIEAFYTGNVEKSSELLQHAETIDPKNIPIQVNLGIVYRHLGKSADALSEFHKVLGVKPENAAALNGIGRVQLDAGQFKDAETNLKRAIVSNNAPVETLLNLGELAEHQENWTLAAQYYGRYLLDPSADSALKIMVSRRNQNIASFTSASTKAKE